MAELGPRPAGPPNAHFSIYPLAATNREDIGGHLLLGKALHPVCSFPPDA